MRNHFNARRRVLVDAMLAAADGVLREAGATLDRGALHQMSVNLEEVAGEILMFGGDLWPVEVEE